MDWQTGITFMSIVAGSLSLGMSFLLWQYRALPGAKPLMAAALAVALWALLYTLELQTGADVSRLLLWYRLKHLGLVFVETLVVVFALDFAGRSLSRVSNAALLAVPLITLLLVLTNAGGWYWSDLRVMANAGYAYLSITPGAWFWVFVVYQTTLLLMAMITLVRDEKNAVQNAIVVIACGVPLIARLVSINTDIFVDATPFMYMAMIVVFVFVVMQIGVFDVLPDAYDTVVKNNPDGVLVVDTRNRVLMTNPMFGRLTGIQPNAIVGNDLFASYPRLHEWIHDIQTVRVGLAEALDGDRHIEMRIIPLFNGTRFNGRAFLFRDITDRKHAEAALRASETRYRTLFDQAQDAIIVEDNRLNIIDANAATTRLLGYTHAELLGMTSDHIQPEPFRYETPDVKSGRFEMQAVRKDQNRLDVEVTVAPIPDRDRLIYMSIMRDVTERKRNQVELKKRADELASLYEQVSLLEQYKTDMIRMAAHDLRHPITVILGYVELLSNMADNLTDAQHKYMRSIRNSVNRANTMLSDILSLERIEEQALNGIHDTFNFHMTLGEIIAQYRDQASARHQRIIIDVDPDDSPYDIIGDISQVTEAIGNLLNNAIKYTSDGGEITVRLSNNGNHLIFEVRDTGYGIPKELQERLFRPFYRAKTSETSHIEGTGLGLHLVKNIVERHGGTVLFRSVHGEGSMFGFRLPLHRPGVIMPPAARITTQTFAVVRPLYPTVD